MNALSKTLSLSVLLALCLSFSRCGEKKEEKISPPDPLAGAAGTYSGNVEENNKIITGVKANLTTSPDGNGKLYISSVGLTSSSYQLVLSRSSSYLKGEKNGLTYLLREQVNGNVLNISGTYSYGPNYVQNTFSFTGTKQ